MRRVGRGGSEFARGVNGRGCLVSGGMAGGVGGILFCSWGVGVVCLVD